MKLPTTLLIYLLLFIYLECRNHSINKKLAPKKLGKDKTEKIQNIKRKLEEGDEEVEEPHYFDNLSIFLDTYNLNDSFPYDKEKYLDIFNNAAKNAKEKIENFIQIEIDSEAQILDYDVSELKEDWEIEKWDEDFFGTGDKKFQHQLIIISFFLNFLP